MALKLYCIIVIACIFSYVVQANNAELPPNCNKVLNETNFIILPNTVTSTDDIHYSVVYLDQNISHATCDITYNNALRIRFRKVTKITDILIRHTLDARTNEALKLSLLRGNSSFDCNQSGHSNMTDLIYEKYACSPQGFVNALEIRSSNPWTVDLTSLRKHHERLEWIILLDHNTQGCHPPGLYPGQRLNPFKTYYLPGEEVQYLCENNDFEIKPLVDTVRCNNSGNWSNKAPLCQLKDLVKKYHSNLSPTKPKAAVGMRNVSQVAADFPHHGYNNITQIEIIFSIRLNQSELDRVVKNNVAINLFSSTHLIHNHFIRRISYPENFRSAGFISHALNNSTACMNCSVEVTFLNYYWDFDFVKNITINASSTFESVEEEQKLSKGCPPVEPYLGMPQSYLNYELILNGSINGLLRETPCRDGFELKEPKHDIVKCTDGKWIGKGFPVCEVLRTKRPPEVSFATWRYVHDDTFHEVVYICENGQTINAKYDLKANGWKIGTGCQRASELVSSLKNREFSQPYLLIGAIGLSAFVVCLIATVVGCYIRLKMSRAASSSLGPASVSSTHPCQSNEYTLERKRLSQLQEDDESIYEQPLDLPPIPEFAESTKELQ